MIPPQLLPVVEDAPWWKRPVAVAVYTAAVAQRDLAVAEMERWPVPEAAPAVETNVLNFTGERDAVLLMRMASSFLARVGAPRRFTVVSDGSLSARSARSVGRLHPSVEIVDWRDLCAGRPLPDAVDVYAGHHPLGKKLAVLMSIPEWPVLFVDSDIEFYAGAHRLRELINGDPRARWYMRETSSAYDERMTAGLELRPGINSGFFTLPGPLDWGAAVERLGPFAETGGEWTEQTAFAIALSATDARTLPPDDYVIHWDDAYRPWDHVARRDVVLRHYLSWALRWKLWLRGGPRGYRTIPVALVMLLRRLRGHHAGV